MSTQRNDGGPAYPRAGFVSEMEGEALHYDSKPQAGMTLRDYFAGQALVGLLAMDAHPSSTGDAAIDCEGTANRAYGLADAMLAEREKGGDK